jgi:hypothetical protein
MRTTRYPFRIQAFVLFVLLSAPLGAALEFELTPAGGAGADAYTDSNQTTTAFGQTDPVRLLIRRANTKAYIRYDLSAHADHGDIGGIESAEITIQQTGNPLRLGEDLELFAVNLNYNFANDGRLGIDWSAEELTHANAPASGAGGSVSTANSRSLLVGRMEQSVDGVYYRYAETAGMEETPLLDYLNGTSGFSRTDTALRLFIIAEAPDQARNTKVFASAENTVGAAPPTLSLRASLKQVSYFDWAGQFGLPEGEGDPRSSPARDGVSNAVKYALGLHPLEPVARPFLAFELGENGEGRRLAMEAPLNPAARASVSFEVSSDLANWDGGPDHVDILEETATLLRVRDKGIITPGNNRFMRLRVALEDAGRYAGKVVQHLDTLLEHGRDSYGPEATPLFVGVLDDGTLVAPSDPSYAPFPRASHPPDERALGGANLWRQADLLRILHRMADHNPEFAEAADAHLTHYVDNLAVFSRIGQGGMLWWGNHLHYDVFSDQPVTLSKLDNEINMGIQDPVFMWERMWDLRPEEALEQVEKVWEWFVFDKENGRWDRHANNNEYWAVGFSQAGASFLRAFAVAYARTGNSIWKARAEKLRDHMWSRRDPVTGLIPNAANASAVRGGDLFWRCNFASSHEPGYWVPALIHCHGVFGDAAWLQQAGDIMTSYLTHAYDAEAGAFYRWIRLDGVYDPDYPVDPDDEYGSPEPGYSSFWRDASNFRVNAYIGLAALEAFEAIGDPFHLEGAELIGQELLTREPTSDSGSGGAAVGAWAEHYASAIHILIGLHRHTAKTEYLERAVYIADHALEKLWNPQSRIFRGHFHHGYEIADGTDRLCEVLAELDAYLFNEPF